MGCPESNVSQSGRWTLLRDLGEVLYRENGITPCGRPSLPRCVHALENMNHVENGVKAFFHLAGVGSGSRNPPCCGWG